MKIPRHIAFIMDGNGRWAKQRNLPITKGHETGMVTLERVLDHCFDLGVKTITLYAFSSENWKRSEEEKKILFNLLRLYFNEKLDRVLKRNTKIKVIGDIEKFSDDLQQVLRRTEEISSENSQYLLQLALSYGGRNEIIRATKKVCRKVVDGELKLEEIDEESFSQQLDTEGSDPDLLIRTSGEIRISNFLLYQMAYTEFFFTTTLWPDLTNEEIDQAIEEFNNRERRYGGR